MFSAGDIAQWYSLVCIHSGFDPPHHKNETKPKTQGTREPFKWKIGPRLAKQFMNRTSYEKSREKVAAKGCVYV
jgi:hypothetical protein